MAIEIDFRLGRTEDGVVQVSMTPPVAIGGWAMEAVFTNRFGGESGLITKRTASGYGAGGSGLQTVNSGLGIFNLTINSADTSGLNPGNYAYEVKRTDSGNVAVLTKGYMILDE